jgi:hypothetical protein
MNKELTMDDNTKEHTDVHKQVTEDWEEYVRSEVSAALDMFLPDSKDGKLGVIYKKALRENTEAGPVYHDNKVDGVEIIISLNFQEVMDKVM